MLDYFFSYPKHFYIGLLKVLAGILCKLTNKDDGPSLLFLQPIREKCGQGNYYFTNAPSNTRKAI